MKNSYQFSAKCWEYSGKGAWIFVAVPKDFSAEIRNSFKIYEEGWGRLKCEAQIGISTWKTAIWFDSKKQVYLLPLKAEIRKLEKIVIDKIVCVKISI